MTLELGIVVGVTVLALVLFVTEWLRVDVVALLVLSVLLLTGILTPVEGLEGLSNEATITIGAMFVLSEGLRQTGALNALTRRLRELFELHYLVGLTTLMIGAAFASAFINNVAIVAIMLPVVIGLCRDLDISPTWVLIPLSFAAMFGGTTTLVGTSANLLVSGLVTDYGLEPIGMFELTPVGLAFIGVGIAYLLIAGQHLLPTREATELEETYELGKFRADLRVLADHDAVGSPVCEVFSDHKGIQLLAVFRNNQLLRAPIDEITVHAGDVLRISSSARALGLVDDSPGLELIPLDSSDEPTDQRAPFELFEVLIDPDSSLAGRKLRDIHFPERYPGTLIALRRSGEVVVDDLQNIRLRGGDLMLMQASRDEMAPLHDSEDLIVISEIGLPGFKSHFLIPVLVVFALVIILAAIGWMPIVNLAVAAASLLVAIGVLSADEAYRSIDWEVIFLLGGFIPLGTALEKTGAIDLIADGLVATLGGYGPLAMLAGFYLITNVMSAIISNQATAVLMTPLAIASAAVLGADPRPYIVAIAFAASASFASPIGYHTNVMIYSAGNYRFMDFIKIGVPLNALLLVVAVVLIPQFWPL